MGNSASAILFYGYCWTDEEQWPWNIGKEGAERDDEYGWEKRYAARTGTTVPADYADRRVWTDKIGVDVCTWNHHEYALPYVAIASSMKMAHAAMPKSIDSIATNPEWRAQLDDFCRVMGIEIPADGPKWWLVPDYG